ncbi:SRPBCC domain-containing protein [candidate division KSB1 bacterium]|nr:SRPBCC domain-containing protein [candidate division KSB1 bacterium]
MRSIKTQIDIKGTPEHVWQALMDFSAYPNWNPFVLEVAGDVKVGSKIKVILQAAEMKPATFQPTVVKIEPNKEFRWLGKMFSSALFQGEHVFSIKSQNNGSVLFSHCEYFGGMLVPFLGSLFKKTERGFEAMNQALRQRVESIDVKEITE